MRPPMLRASGVVSFYASEEVRHRGGRASERCGELGELGVGPLEAAGGAGGEGVEPTRVECSQLAHVGVDGAAAAALDRGAAAGDAEGPAAGVVGEDVVGNVEIE